MTLLPCCLEYEAFFACGGTSRRLLRLAGVGGEVVDLEGRSDWELKKAEGT